MHLIEWISTSPSVGNFLRFSFFMSFALTGFVSWPQISKTERERMTETYIKAVNRVGTYCESRDNSSQRDHGKDCSCGWRDTVRPSSANNLRLYPTTPETRGSSRRCSTFYCWTRRNSSSCTWTSPINNLSSQHYSICTKHYFTVLK